MKNEIEFVGVVVKVNGKRKMFAKEKCEFQGWEWSDENWADSGVNLFLTNGKKQYKISVGN